MNTERDNDAHHLTDLHRSLIEAHHEAAEHPDPATIAAALRASNTLDDACETFRRRWYPRTYKVIAVFGEVYTMSRTGRSTHLVWSEEHAKTH